MTQSTLGLTRLQATFAALRYPEFRRWLVGLLSSLAGTWMQSVAQGWLVYQITGSKLALGTIAAAGTILMLFDVLAGAIADRIPKRRLLMLTQITMMVSALILAMLTWAKVLQIWQIALLARRSSGIAELFDVPARLALVPQLIDDRRDLQSAIATGATMFNLARSGSSYRRLCVGRPGCRLVFRHQRPQLRGGIDRPGRDEASRRCGPAAENRHMVAEIGDGLRYLSKQPVIRA